MVAIPTGYRRRSSPRGCSRRMTSSGQGVSPAGSWITVGLGVDSDVGCPVGGEDGVGCAVGGEDGVDSDVGCAVGVEDGVGVGVGVGCGLGDGVALSPAWVGSLLASGVAAGSGTAALSSTGGESS